MTGWKNTLQIRDLDSQQRMELTCKNCGHVRYLTSSDVLAQGGRSTLYLDEVERRARCKMRGCKGQVRLALPRRGDTSGFVGGLA